MPVRIVGLAGCILLCEMAGVIGALTTETSGSAWYQSLAKPSFNPPSWVFAPVWTLLYALMGVSLYLLMRRWPATRLALTLFGVQLVLNAAWTPLFFGMHQIDAALLALLAMGLATLWLIIIEWPGWAAMVLLPYLAWLGYAAALNVAFVRLN